MDNFFQFKKVPILLIQKIDNGQVAFYSFIEIKTRIRNWILREIFIQSVYGDSYRKTQDD